MKHIWTVLCQSSSVDYESNLISLSNVIEEINFVIDKTANTLENKIILPNVQLVSYWSVDKGEDSLEIKTDFVDPDNKIINSFNNISPIKKGLLRFRNRANLQGLAINKGGRYIFRISNKIAGKFEIVAEIPLDINITYKTTSPIKK